MNFILPSMTLNSIMITWKVEILRSVENRGNTDSFTINTLFQLHKNRILKSRMHRHLLSLILNNIQAMNI